MVSSSRHPVRVGLKVRPQGTTIDVLRAVWRIADDAGFDHVWTFDHLAGVGDEPVDAPVYEGWTLLAAMAEATTRVRVGCMVTSNTYRHPGVLAKMAVTVDHLSGGRLEFGIGAGWAEGEHLMLGLEFPSRGERLERLGEACEVIQRLWREDGVDYDGRFYRLSGAVARPGPLQRPRPPFWIGGTGETKTLRLVARYADAWNVPGGRTPETAARLSAVLAAHCAAVERDPAEIRRGVQSDFPDVVDDYLREVERFVRIGFTEPVIEVWGPEAERMAHAAAETLLPRIRQMG